MTYHYRSHLATRLANALYSQLSVDRDTSPLKHTTRTEDAIWLVSEATRSL